MKRFVFLYIIFLSISLGCQNPPRETPDPVNPSSEMPAKEAVSKEPAFPPFYVYKNKGYSHNHYVPSGFMPNGKCINFNDRWQENCHEGSSCIKINYDIACSMEGQNWAGVYWLNPANNWGRSKGGFDLTGARELTFWARGDKGGEQIQQITVGGIDGDYPDSDKIVIGPLILSDQWRKYSVDLTGRDLSYISGGFAWSSETAVNPDECVFYFDEIRFE